MKIDVTEDGIVLSQNKNQRNSASIIWVLLWFFFVIIGLIGAGGLLSGTNNGFVAFLMIIFSGVFFIENYFFGTTVTVDRTFKRIFLKKDSFLKPLNSLKEIPFSDIKKFGLELHSWEEEWLELYLITNDNKSELILISDVSSDSKSRIVEIANTISFETGKDIDKTDKTVYVEFIHQIRDFLKAE